MLHMTDDSLQALGGGSSARGMPVCMQLICFSGDNPAVAVLSLAEMHLQSCLKGGSI